MVAGICNKWVKAVLGDNQTVRLKSTNKPEDSALTKQLNEFLRQVEQRAFVVARLATQNPDDALDIVQDAMLKLVQNYSQQPKDEWGALFHTILHSRINDWHRRQQVRNRWQVWFKTNEDEDDAPVLEEQVAQTLFAEPEAASLQAELNEVLYNAIGKLPLRQQQVVLLRLWEGYDIAATARIMQCAEGSVKTHLSRALANLRDSLGDYQ